MSTAPREACAPRTQGPQQRHVLGDWGTSRLRLFLLENGEIADSREGPGIGASNAAPADTLAALIAPWMDAMLPMDVWLSGMIGSRNGLFEVPYAVLPVDCAAWARAACSTRVQNLNITIAAGLRGFGLDGVPDVMRGEETQLFGAMLMDATLCRGLRLFVLPGTHSKWVEVKDGAVMRFRTVLTGEVYALLCDRSILLKAGGVDDHADSDADAGFVAGVERSAGLPDGLLAALFETRTAQLLQHRSRAWASGFLSGLLIGHEVASLSATYSLSRGVTLVGDPSLTALYRGVFADRGVDAQTLDGTPCVIAGLRYLQDRVAGT